jgi:simple sugar transport system ATP-binding protein
MSEHTIVGEHRNANLDMDRLLAQVAGEDKDDRRGAA